MGKRGIAILKGIEVDEVLKLLNSAYSEEWLAYYQYFVEAQVVKGAMKDAAIAELNQHAADELNHANLVANRIVQLGGTPVLHPSQWFELARCTYLPPEDPNVLKVLEQAIEGEQCAINTYSNMIEITRDKDVVTYDLASQILADEVEHEEDLQSLHEDIQELVSMYKS